MAKQLNSNLTVNLSFSADTAKAKAQLKDLQQQLTKLSQSVTSDSANFTLTDDLKESVMAAQQLSAQLRECTNADTGKLDLGKFSQTLSASGMKLQDYKKTLSALGPQGTQAFASLATSITNAEVPLRRSNALVTEMWTTLKNTARWQLSSSILHGFMGALQSAYGYAKDLNNSLNNIRIVTGQSVEQMDKFAKKANQAAKELSTSTLAYTDAALIFYQQGLNDQAVEERTAATIKLANVTGESAQEVSSYMTAIWNNFNDGSQNLEYFGDVLAKLGATTAASSAEIAGGLEKFAAIGDTIGLSYEYAASALATIVDKTRQSEDVVGTALKTIFARIQGLNLGETLDDGTSLNKYSQALMTVGISIKDNLGNLKDMDTILDEMGSRWNTISDDQQVALAQTVAGVRQYNQLISLMDNWNSMQNNVDAAVGSAGTLSIQSDIYAQSWEAAEERVRAAAEGIYDSLLNDDFFIEMNNGFADILTSVEKMIDGIGGFKGILLALTPIITKLFHQQLAKGIDDAVYGFKMMTKKGREAVESMRDEANKLLIEDTVSSGTPSGQAVGEAYNEQGKLQEAYLQNVEKMSESQKQIAQSLLDQQQTMIQNVALAGEQLDKAQEQVNLAERQSIKGVSKDVDIKNIQQAQKAYGEAVQQIQKYRTALEQIGKIKLNDGQIKNQVSNLKQWRKELQMTADDIENLFGPGAKKAMENFDSALQKDGVSVDELNNALDRLYSSIDSVEDKSETLQKALRTAFSEAGIGPEEQEQRIQKLAASYAHLGTTQQELAQKSSILASYTDQVAQSFEKMQGVATLGDKLVAVATTMSSVVSIINIFKSTLDTLNDTDASFGDKILAVMTGLGMVIPMVTSAFNANNIAMTLSGVASTKLGAKALGLMGAKVAETGAVVANTAAWYANPIMWIALIIAGVIAAVVALIATISKLTELLITGEKIETENCQTLIDNANKTRELASANEELADSMDDLVDNFYELEAAGESTANVLEKMKDQMPELIASYKELSKSGIQGLSNDVKELERLGETALITGDFAAFTEQKTKMDNKIAIQNAKASKAGATNANMQLAAAMQEAGAKNDGDSGKLTFKVGGVNTRGTNEETKAQNILYDTMGEKYATKKDYKNGVHLTANYTNPTEFVDYYERMVAARDEMLNTMTQEEINHSDIFREIDEMIKETSDSYQTAKEQADAYIDVAGDALIAEMGKSGSAVSSMEEYLAYQEEFIKKAKEQYNLTEEQAKAYLAESENVGEIANQYRLATIMAEKYSGIDMNSGGFTGVADDYYKLMSEVFGDLDEQEIQIAVGIAEDSNDLDEFVFNLQNRMLDMSQASYQQSADLAAQIMSDSIESNELDLSKMFSDENFLTFLEEQNTTMEEMTAKSYEEQYQIISKFYSDVNTLAFATYQEQEALGYNRIAELQAEIANYNKFMQGPMGKNVESERERYAQQQEAVDNAKNEEDRVKAQKVLDDMARKFQGTYGFSIESNIQDMENEIKSLMDSLDELQDKRIELAMDWSEVDKLQEGLEDAAALTQFIQKDTKKVGETYQLTTAQAQEWLKFYPELGKNAQTVGEGIIALDASVVDNFIQGKEDSMGASIDATKGELEAQKSVLESELKMKEAEFNAAKALAEGKMNLEDVSNKYLVDLRTNLTDYYAQCGFDEVEANRKALETMGLNEQEYSDLVAQSCTTNVKNIGDSADEGAQFQLTGIKKVWKKWTEFGSYIKNNIGQLLSDLGDAILNPKEWKKIPGMVKDFVTDYWDEDDTKTGIDTSKVGYEGSGDSGDFATGVKYDPTAAMKAVADAQLEGIEVSRKELEAAIAEIDNQLLILDALKEGGLAGFNSTSIEDEEEAKAAKYANYLRALGDEAERYHVITKEIEKLEHELDKVSKIKDRAFGLEKVNAMNKELAKLKELQKTQKEYMSQVKMALQYDKENLAKYGISVDKNGLVENYESIATSTADYSAYNNALKEWNSQTSEEGQKALDEKWAGVYNEATGEFYNGYLDWAETLKEDAEKSHEEKMKALQQYEDTWSLYQEVEAALQDRENQIYDAMLEKTSYVVDIRLDVQDRDMQLLGFLLEQIEDASYNAAKSIAMIGLQTENAFKQINIAKSGLQGILENHGFSAEKAQSIIENGNFASLYGAVSFTEEEMSTMSGWIDDIFAKNAELLEMREAAWQNVRDEFNQYLEDMDKGIAKIDRLNDVTKNYQNIIDILGTGVLNVSNDLIEDLNKTIVLNTQNALKASQAELEALKKSREEVMSIDTTGWSEDALRQHQQTIDEMEEAILTAEDNVAQRWQDALQAATDAWKTAVTNIVDEFEDKVAGALGSLSELQESFDRASEIDSRYVEQYEKIYELSKLTRQINKDIDASNNLHVKQELRDLAQEIAEIEASGVEMSKYDLENLQRRYELKKAELALEEANGAKSTVNMVRGGDGSYSYVYTANEEDVAAAEQTYEDKLFAMQQANAEYINSLQGQIIQVQQEYADAIRALQEDTTLSQEEYEKKAAEFAEYYGGKLAYFSDELGKALNNNQQLYTEDWQLYSERTGYKITSNDEYITNFEETNLAIVGGYESLSEVENNFKEASSQMLNDLSVEYQIWQTEIDTVMQLAGTSVQGFSEDVYNAINDDNGIKNQSDEAATSVEEMGQRMESAFESISLSIESWEENWGRQIDLAIEKNNQLMQSYNEMMSLMASGVDETSSSNLNALNSEQPTVEESSSEPEIQTPSPNPSQTKPQAGNKPVNNADKAEGVAAAIWMLGGPASGWGNDPERAKKLKEKGVTGAQAYINQHARNGDIYASWWDRYDELQQYRYGAFDTGGYTGDWGDNSGRLALLHSKEIVLNAEDTKNFLSAIELVREIANIIDLNAAAASGAYSTMSSVGSGLGGGGGITQHVEIHASFPDAVDHSQIEQAFTNLINTASQYANRDR